jgi:hypothetical protein
MHDESGVFEIDWDKMDGIKGSSQRGTDEAPSSHLR